jgi:hypothetical protein
LFRVGRPRQPEPFGRKQQKLQKNLTFSKTTVK